MKKLQETETRVQFREFMFDNAAKSIAINQEISVVLSHDSNISAPYSKIEVERSVITFKILMSHEHIAYLTTRHQISIFVSFGLNIS